MHKQTLYVGYVLCLHRYYEIDAETTADAFALLKQMARDGKLKPPHPGDMDGWDVANIAKSYWVIDAETIGGEEEVG